MHTVGVPTDLDLKKVIADHPNIFAPGLGLCTKTKAHLQLRDGVQPKFLKARPVPFSRIDAVEKELQRLEDLKIVTKVDYSDWATPIVVVQGAVAGTGRRLGRDVEPTSRLGSLDTSERNYWVAHRSRSEPRRPDWPVYSRRGH